MKRKTRSKAKKVVMVNESDIRKIKSIGVGFGAIDEEGEDPLDKVIQDETMKKVFEDTGEAVTKEGDPYNFRKRWPTPTKYLALIYLTSIQSVKQNGEITPRFGMVSALMQINENTLRQWWDQRERILKEKDHILEAGMNYIQMKVMSLTVSLVEYLSNKDFSEMKDSEVIKLLDMSITKIRLLSNMSTQNVAHGHVHRGSVQLVTPDKTKKITQKGKKKNESSTTTKG